MKTQELQQLRNELSRDLRESALRYLEVGLDLFYREREHDRFHIQPAIGNLSTAIELMIKAFLAEAHLTLVFDNLPDELRAIILCPEQTTRSLMPAYKHGLKGFRFKTIDLEKSIAMFKCFFDIEKLELEPYFKLLSRHRNAALHGSLPIYEKYELERIAYLALKVKEALGKKSENGSSLLKSKCDKEFLKAYDENRVFNVAKKIEAAKEKANRSDVVESYCSVDDWDTYVTVCPVCGVDAILLGSTDVALDIDEDGEANPYPVFLAYSLECDNCGLALNDTEELRLAGVGLKYERLEDIDKWIEEQCADDFCDEDYY